LPEDESGLRTLENRLEDFLKGEQPASEIKRQAASSVQEFSWEKCAAEYLQIFGNLSKQA
jgi:glycosyltransferase involved in cell wall biosynthesis